MEHYVMIARSVTYAQQMQSVLSASGIRSQYYRAPRELSDRGCAYAVRVPENQIATALAALKNARLAPVKIYLTQNNKYREAAL